MIETTTKELVEEKTMALEYLNSKKWNWGDIINIKINSLKSNIYWLFEIILKDIIILLWYKNSILNNLK